MLYTMLRYSVCFELMLCNDWIVLHNVEVVLCNNGVVFCNILLLCYSKRAVRLTIDTG